jgi:TRAP-type C4-dicarboxylate transport system permease small subunit
MRRYFDAFESVLKLAVVVIVILMLASLSAQVVLRYVFGQIGRASCRERV